jgi:hypothetical protein
MIILIGTSWQLTAKDVAATGPSRAITTSHDTTQRTSTQDLSSHNQETPCTMVRGGP